MKEPQFSSALDATIAAPAAERRPVGPVDDTLVGADGGAASVDAETLVGEHARGGGRARAVAEATKIGRHVVLGTLGAGGMGMVVAAYDPRLDRKVAIKLIHAPRRDDAQSRVRLEREAQATARLSHPNVVTIYEVGEHEGQLFLALEFVKGQDLGAWLAGRGKSVDWRGILDVFLQAGEGQRAEAEALVRTIGGRD